MYTWIWQHVWPPNFWSKDFSRLQAVTYTVKVVVAQNWCKIYTSLLDTINRKCRMAYRFLTFPTTLKFWMILKLIRLLQGLKKCNSTNIYAALRTVSTDAARRAVQLSFWFFPPEYALIFLAFTLTIKCLSFQESKSTSFPKLSTSEWGLA